MGISFTGEAIGTSVETLARIRKSIGLFYFGHAFMMVADAVFLYIWWQTFRKEAKKAQEAMPVKRIVVGNT
jgi:hypothetical protein